MAAAILRNFLTSNLEIGFIKEMLGLGRHQVSDVSYKQTHKPLGRFLPGSSVKKA